MDNLNINFLDIAIDYRTILYPTHAQASPSTRLIAIYARAVINCPPRSMNRLSFMNVENVVKPPQKPVVRSSFMCGSPGGNLVSKPSRKHPRILQSNVPKGC